MDDGVGAIRSEYRSTVLRRGDLSEDPTDQFVLWFEQAREAQLLEPNAMTLATAGADGRPTQRTVLLKKFDRRGFVFFTNFESNKARQIGENPQVSLLFPWLALERQVIVNGTAAKLPAAEAFKYFVTRPLESQFGAWASPQSSVVTSRKLLQMNLASMKKKFRDGRVPLPPFWGGFRVAPRTIEFWQGGSGRLHDRFQYTLFDEGGWRIERLAP